LDPQRIAIFHETVPTGEFRLLISGSKIPRHTRGHLSRFLIAIFSAHYSNAALISLTHPSTTRSKHAERRQEETGPEEKGAVEDEKRHQEAFAKWLWRERRTRRAQRRRYVSLFFPESHS